MVQSATFGAASVAPTLVQTDQSSPNVIPETLTLTLDWRTVPEEGAEQLLARLAELAGRSAAPGVAVDVRVKDAVWETYTGLSRAYPMAHPAFELAEAHPLVKAARAALEQVYEETVPVYLWRFATDGGHYMAAGIPTVGFGPGDERLAHTTEEHISLGELARGLLGNAALCAQLGEVEF
jgi:acetylornithine deacetylase/succinyl-diaminopimelate desuccinylase-like protein